MSHGRDILLPIATSLDDLTNISITPEQLFARHCAIVGSSGSGKSWTVARLIEESAKFRSKLILFDATGEYRALSKNVFSIHIGKDTALDPNSMFASVPYYELSEPDLISIFEPNDPIQWVKFRSAIKTLKLLHLVPVLGSNGTFPKAQRLKAPFEQAVQARIEQIDRPECIFNIHKLPLQIEFECVEPVRSQDEFNYWGGINSSDHSTCAPLIHRVDELLKTPEFVPLFNPPAIPSAFEAIEKLMTDPGVSVLRISLENLPSTNRIREIVVNALARRVLQMGHLGALSKAPVVLFLDEAHQVLSDDGRNRNRILPTDAFNVIAKEGRKFGVTLCLATQRPHDIPEDVLSQIGTFIVHRLIGENDRRAIEVASGTLDAQHLATLATLGPGEALILGAGIRDARRIKLLPPANPPHSRDPDYQRAWRRVTSKI